MLLSDKEISRIEGYALVDIKPGEHLHSRIMRDIAKAQLKKVVRWILDNGYEDCDGAGESTWVLSLNKLEELLDEDQRQVLLKEIE